MAQTGFTPIVLYHSATGAAAPLAADLAAGELAINTTDEKLYFKNAGGTAKVLANAAIAGITPGTGVATALAVNVGSAGAPVVNGGALGTPSSGSLANCTAYPGTSALVTTGALNSGSITSGFGAIDVGTDAISGGAITGSDSVIVGAAPAYLYDTTWKGSYTFGIGSIGSFASNTHLTHNAVYNGGWKYITTAGASDWYTASNGTILGRIAESGTAANPITWTTVADIRIAGATFSGGINSTTIGATTPAAGSFTTLSATWTTTTTAPQVIFKNASSAAGAWAAMRCTNDGNVGPYLAAASSAYTTYGAITANSGILYTDNAAGLAIVADHASGTVRIAAGSSAATVGTFSSTGAAITGTLSVSGVISANIAASNATGIGQVNIGPAGMSAASSNGGLEFTSNTAGGGYGAKIWASNSLDALVFSGRNASATWVDTLTLRPGVAMALQGGVQTNGTGITFPATQNPSSDANTLDDYEEGTWTPAVTFGGASVGITYTVQSGTYTKIGNTVHVVARMTLSSKGSSTGSASTSGAPFAGAVVSGAGAGGGVPIYWAAFTTTGPGVIANYQATFTPYAANSITITPLTDANYQNTTSLYFNCTYYV